MKVAGTMRHKLGKIYYSFISRFRKVEDGFHETMEIFSEGKFEEARRRFQTLYHLNYDEQFATGKRIHLGASLHMIGLSMLFTFHFEEALEYFLQAYLADVLNTKFGDENKADSAPAYYVLKNVYMVNDEILELTKNYVKEKIDRERPVDVAKAFKEFMQSQDKNPLVKECGNFELLNNGKFSSVKELLEKFFINEKARVLLRKVPPRLYEQIALKSFVIALEDERERAYEKDVRKTLKKERLMRA